jgi:2-polyprenyl-3-methyl-5-hydroxy-6-metoxy-1,4-benzoquinol methylase
MKKVHADGRDNYYLPLTTIKKIDKWLVEKYLIDCLENIEEFYSLRGNGISDKDRKKVDRLIKDYIKYFETDNISKKTVVGLELTNIYSENEWRSWWHSTRRAWLIDSLSFCSSIIGHLAKKNKEISVIDVGCNVGIHSNYLAENYPIKLTGIDFAENAITKAIEFRTSFNANFQQCDLEEFKVENQFDVAIAVDFIQPNENNFSSLIDRVGRLVKPNGDFIVVGNLIGIDNVDEFFRSIGFSCLGAQLTGGYQQGHSQDFGIDWSTKAALHFKKNLNLKSVPLPISGDMYDFAAYANSGEFPNRELNRSYFLPRIAQNLVTLD